MSGNKKIKNATPLQYQGILFRSKLEVVVYKALEEAGLNPAYETETFVLMQGFKPYTPFYTKNKKTKELELQNKKLIDWKYTPDFSVKKDDWVFYIEVKGRQNDVYPYKRKMFLKLLEDKNNVAFFEVFTKTDCLKAIEIINNYGKKEA